MVDTLNKAGAYVKLGIKIANTDDRVTKFSLLRGTNNEFVLVFSVSHSVVDGDTYYKILNMLREDSKIESLEMERLAARYVDKTNIDQAKAEARKVQNDDFFVSTNDILVSSFAMEAGSDVLLMPFNLRGRHDHVKDSSAGVKDSSAGNYEHVLYYDGKDSYGDPEHIRNSLRQGPPYRRVNPKAMPNWRKRMTSDYSMITSWAFSFFHADRHLWNSAGKPNTSSLVKLHLPLYDRKEIVPQPFGVIFKPCKDKLAVMYFYAPKNNCYARLVAKGTVLGGAARSMKKCLFD